jgi:hypothetical protein
MSDVSRTLKPVLIAAGLVAIVPALSAAQGPGPHRKAGMWESTMAMPGQPAITTGMCTDEAFEQRMGMVNPQQMGARECANMAPTPIPGGYRIDGTCSNNGRTTKIKATIKGDLNSAYAMDVDVDANGKPQTMHMDVKRTGPCGEGVKPGDMVMTVNGRRMVMNMDAVRAGAPPAPR